MPVTSSVVRRAPSGSMPRPRHRREPESRAASRLMRLLVERPGHGRIVVTVSGEVDALTAPRLGELLTNRLRSGARMVIVDLSAVAFLGAAGLSVLAQAALAARIAGIELLVVTGDNRVVRRVLDLTGMNRELTTMLTSPVR